MNIEGTMLNLCKPSFKILKTLPFKAENNSNNGILDSFPSIKYDSVKKRKEKSDSGLKQVTIMRTMSNNQTIKQSQKRDISGTDRYAIY